MKHAKKNPVRASYGPLTDIGHQIGCMRHEDKLGRNRGFVPHTANANHRFPPGRPPCEPRCFQANLVSRCFDRGHSAPGTASQRPATAHSNWRLITVVPLRGAVPHRADIDETALKRFATRPYHNGAAGRGGRCRLWQRKPALRQLCEF